jgi:hypothetical protein
MLARLTGWTALNYFIQLSTSSLTFNKSKTYAVGVRTGGDSGILHPGETGITVAFTVHNTGYPQGIASKRQNEWTRISSQLINLIT